MKKLLLLLLLVPLLAYGQTIDTAKVAVWYEAKYNNGVEDVALTTSREVLEIGNKYTCYYSWDNKLYNDYMDSICKANPNEDIISVITSAANATNSLFRDYKIYKCLSNDSLTYFNSIWKRHFKYEQGFPVNDWRLAEGDTTILSMPCNKASLDLHERHWTVWYTTEMPISDGPWKLKGLPGLIMKASESEGIFSFNCVGIDKITKPIEFESKRAYNTNPKRFEDELKKFRRGQTEYVFRQSKIPHTPGLWKNEKSYTPCLMEFY